MAQRRDLQIVVLDPVDEGRRLRRLRRLAGATQTEIGTALGFLEKSAASKVSKRERGLIRIPDSEKKLAANFLAGRGDLTADAHQLFGYLTGDPQHDSLDACLNEDADGGGEQRRRGDLNPGRGFSPCIPLRVAPPQTDEDRLVA